MGCNTGWLAPQRGDTSRALVPPPRAGNRAALLGLLGALGAWLPGGAAAQVDATFPKPVVILMVDSSGSMERMPNTSDSNDELPDCSTPDKNRWTITLEALTGDFNDYGCSAIDRTSLSSSEHDYGYHLPHFRPSFSSQSPTGVLDVYLSRAKFGLMTFDSIATYVDGPVFESYTALSNSVDRTSSRGMYSYGNVGKLVFPGCNTAYGIDNGARNDNASAGWLVSPGVSDDSPDIKSVNQSIQEALIGTSANSYEDGIRPFGGTPVAGMLDDLTYFLDNDSSVAAGSDLYRSCRKRVAILITDGKPDSNFRDDRFNCDPGDDNLCVGDAGVPCSCPYDTEANYVSELCEKGASGECSGVLDSFFVVALSLSDDEDAVATLNELAEEGGTEEAYLADSAADLSEALQDILNLASDDATTRTAPLVKTSGIGTQYELTAGFRIPDDQGAWEGVLERQRWECDGTTPVKVDLSNSGKPKDLLHVALDEQSSRNIHVVNVPAADGYDITLSPYVDDIDSDSFEGDTVNREGVEGDVQQADTSGNDNGTDSESNVSPSSLAQLSLDATKSMFGAVDDLNQDSSANDEDYTYAVSWLEGDEDAGRTSKLGGIYHSQPTVVAPEPANTTNQNLNNFLEVLENQPQTVVVGTTDGLLHAFSLELDTFPGVTDGSLAEAFLGLSPGEMEFDDVEPGKEIWAIAPPAVLPSVPTAVVSNQLLFDGSPIVRSLTLKRELGTQSGGTYRRVMVATLRGLPAVVAFDLTNISKPKFMWQYTHPMMGQTVGQPVVVQLRVQWNDGKTYERAVGLFPGGEGETDSSCDGAGLFPEEPSADVRDDTSEYRCWKHKGRYLYAVDIATGSLLQVFDHNIFPAPLTGGITADAIDIGVTANSAYLTDADGVLYRVDFTSADPNEWKVEPLWDLFHGKSDGRAALYPPIITQDDDGQNVLIVGTGDIDNLTDTIENRVVSLTETLYDTDGNFTPTMVQNWEVTLESAEAVTGPLVLFDEVVYFASFVAITNPNDLCDPGESRIWGLHYQDVDASDAPISHLFTDPADAATREPYFDQTVTGYEFLGTNLLVGVSIGQEPTCVPVDDITNTYLGQRYQPSGGKGGGNFSLRAIVSGGGGSRAANSSVPQVEVAIVQPDNTMARVPGSFGTALE